MKAIASIEINAHKEKVWEMLTDFKNWSNVISAIQKIEIIQEPSNGFVGLKWIETRMMFRKEAIETMWVTESKENSFYKTRAESHGAIYLTKLSIIEKDNMTIVTQEFEGLPQNFSGKLIMGLMGGIMKKFTEKAFYEDLQDIKAYIENKMKIDI